MPLWLHFLEMGKLCPPHPGSSNSGSGQELLLGGGPHCTPWSLDSMASTACDFLKLLSSWSWAAFGPFSRSICRSTALPKAKRTKGVCFSLPGSLPALCQLPGTNPPQGGALGTESS